LLFYAKNGECIMCGSDENTVSMRVDMTGKGDFIDFAIPEVLNNWVEYGMKYDIGFDLGQLADGIQATFWSKGTEVSTFRLKTGWGK
jgi:hypothetical protein